MLSSISNFPRLISLEDEIDEVYSNIMDSIDPFSSIPKSFMVDNFPFSRKRRHDDTKYVISISVGKHYKLSDIKISVESKKLIVKGDSSESFKNGKNQHHFERSYDLPDSVNSKSMKSSINDNGVLVISFDKVPSSSSKEMVDSSTDKEFSIKYNFENFQPDEVSVKVHNRDIIVEASKKSSMVNHSDNVKVSSSAYISRTLHVSDDVDIEKLKAVQNSDGSVEIKAPKSSHSISSSKSIPIENSSVKKVKSK